MGVNEERWVLMGEACQQLGLPPKAFRQLLAEFGDLTDTPRPSGDGLGQEISESSLGRLKECLERRNRGESVQDIRASFGPVQKETPGSPEAPRLSAPDPEVAADVSAGPVANPPSAATSGRSDFHDLGGETCQSLLRQIESLTHELSRSEEKRSEDRDRLLTALMRTQQEIQHLRFELVAHCSRKDRKKSGLWSKLFG